MPDFFEFFFTGKLLRTAGGPGPNYGIDYSKQGPTPCQIAVKGAKDRLREELRELFPELQTGTLVEGTASPKAKHNQDHHSPSDGPPRS
ncbi:MAG: hypothetical protein AAF922_11955 [Pseudomonadota bacterium]